MNEQGRQRRGFTLVELMIVVAIIALLVAAAVPTFLAYSSEHAAEEGARIISQQIRGLVSVARSSNRAIMVRVTVGNPNTHNDAPGPLASNNGAVIARMSPDNNCRAWAEGTGIATLTMDLEEEITGQEVNIVQVGPDTDGTDLLFCIRPSGQIVDGITFTPLGPDASSQTNCGTAAYDTTQGNLRSWSDYCDNDGVGCIRVASINTECALAGVCADINAGCLTHNGPNHIVRISYSGSVRVVQ